MSPPACANRWPRVAAVCVCGIRSSPGEIGRSLCEERFPIVASVDLCPSACRRLFAVCHGGPGPCAAACGLGVLVAFLRRPPLVGVSGRAPAWRPELVAMLAHVFERVSVSCRRAAARFAGRHLPRSSWDEPRQARSRLGHRSLTCFAGGAVGWCCAESFPLLSTLVGGSTLCLIRCGLVRITAHSNSVGCLAPWRSSILSPRLGMSAPVSAHVVCILSQPFTCVELVRSSGA